MAYEQTVGTMWVSISIYILHSEDGLFAQGLVLLQSVLETHQLQVPTDSSHHHGLVTRGRVIGGNLRLEGAVGQLIYFTSGNFTPSTLFLFYLPISNFSCHFLWLLQIDRRLDHKRAVTSDILVMPGLITPSLYRTINRPGAIGISIA